MRILINKGITPGKTMPTIHALKITILSTMLVAEAPVLGESGFSELIEADGRRVLVDTGGHPQTLVTYTAR